MSQVAYETSDFRHDYRRASKQQQDKIDAFIRKFSESTTRAGMDLKTPKLARDPRVKTARVDLGLRAVLVDTGQGAYALVRVMEHDAAYRFAERLRTDVSSFTGLPRLIEMTPALEASERRDALPDFMGDVMRHRSDDDFALVGVPPFVAMACRRLPDVAAVGAIADELGRSDPLLGFALLGLVDVNTSMEDLVDQLLELDGRADESADREGAWSGVEVSDRREEIDVDDLAGALSRPGAEERFRIVEDSEELLRALRGEFADWQVFLHPLQKRAAYARYGGPARVSGGAGTGKTVVLLHRAKALLERGDPDLPPRILLTTYTTHLKQDLRRLLEHLIGDRAEDVEIETVDGLARTAYRQMTGSEAVAELGPTEEAELWARIAADHGAGRSAAFLRNEYRHVLLARSVRTLPEYLAVSRAGRGVALSSRERQVLWPAFEAFDANTRDAGRLSTLQMTETVAALVERLPSASYDHVLVDEAQDLHASQWRLLRALVPPGRDDLFMAGDALQRIYGDTVSLRALGIEVRGRSVRLRRNYRSTHEIVGWALGLVSDETVVDIDDLGTTLSGYHSVRHGPHPAFRAYDSPAQEVDGVVETVRGWLRSGHSPEAVAVTARQKDHLPTLVSAFQRAGLPVGQLGRRGRLEGVVNVATMHRLKGLEYPCVAVTGMSADRVPAPGAVCPPEDDRTQHLIDLQSERSLAYVAATRARDELMISWHGRPSDLIHAGVAVGTTPTKGDSRQ